MLTRDDLKTLAAHQGEHPVVSVFLDLDPRKRVSQDAYRARLKGLLKSIEAQAALEDIEAVDNFFSNEFDWTGRSVAAFSSQAAGLWQVYQFAVPLRGAAYVGPKPFIMPLANLIDSYGSFSVAYIDQQAIRMHHFHLGKSVDTEQMTGDEVKRIKDGGGGTTAGARGGVASRERESVRSNLRDFGTALEQFCKRHKTEHIVLCGAETTIAGFRDMLGSPFRDRVEGTFNAPSKAAEHKLLEQALDIMDSRNKERDLALLETIQTQAAKGANGIVGLEATLEAVQSGRVQTLALNEGILAPEDAQKAIWQTIDNGGTIVFIEQDVPVVLIDGIGALLRY